MINGIIGVVGFCLIVSSAGAAETSDVSIIGTLFQGLLGLAMFIYSVKDIIVGTSNS